MQGLHTHTHTHTISFPEQCWNRVGGARLAIFHWAADANQRRWKRSFPSTHPLRMDLKWWWPTTLWHNHPSRSCLIMTHTFWPLTTPRAWQEERWVSEERKEQSKHVKGQASHTHSSINKINGVSKKIKKLQQHFHNLRYNALDLEIRNHAFWSNDDLLHHWQILLMYCTQLLLFFFPEIGVHWKHCAFAIFLSSASAGIETCHSHTSHSNRELKQQCYIKLHLMEMHPGALCRGV